MYKVIEVIYICIQILFLNLNFLNERVTKKKQILYAVALCVSEISQLSSNGYWNHGNVSF